MEMLRRRPLAVFGLSFAYAGFAGIHLSPVLRAVCIALSGVFLFCLLLPLSAHVFPDLRRVGRIFFCGIFCGMSLLTLYTDLFFSRTLARLDTQTAAITGVVESREYAASYMAAYAVRLYEADEQSAGCTILLETADTALSPGDAIACEATFSAFAENSGGFAEKRYYYARGILLRAEADSVQRLGERSAGIRGAFVSLRTALTARLQVSLGRQDAALPAALFLGDRTLLPDTLNRDFRRLGISHMLAISGFHFTLLLGGAQRLLSAVLPSKKPRLLLMAGLCVFYMFLSGLTESVLRAGLMMLLSYAAAFLDRESDMPTSLGMSAAMICLVNPASFYSVGLQLSVTAVAALGCFSHLQSLFSPKTEQRPLLRRGMRLLSEVTLPIAVQLGTLPLLCMYFGEASLLTPLVTILFTPLIQLLLLLTPFLLLMPHLAPLIGAVSALAGWTQALAGWFSAFRSVTVSLRYPLCPYFAFALAGAFGCAAFVRRRRHAGIALLSAGLLLLSFSGYLALSSAVTARQNTVVSVQTKTNDGLILRSGGKALLCDISNGSYSALRAVHEEARQHHATEVEALLLTHLHKRHIQSFSRLSDAAYVRALILPAPVTESEESIVGSLCETAAEKGISVYLYDASAGAVIRFGEMEIFPGARTYLSRSTHPVITLRVECGSQSVQYLGTSWNETDEYEGAPPADVLILGAHGPIYKSGFTLPENGVTQRILVRGDSGEHWEAGLSGVQTVRGDASAVLRFAD